MSGKHLFLSGLNGLRAIAAISVVVTHIALQIESFNLTTYFFGKDTEGNPLAWYSGSMGVTIFFVLCGFLITYFLLIESNKTEIDIKKFYIRRILRIWPIYYLYLLICLILIYILTQQIETKKIVFYVFFAANIPFIYEFTLRFLDHFWSIGVEEQFYLFWPWIIKKTKKYLLPTLIFLILAINCIRYYVWWKYPFTENAIFLIVNRFDCMMIGGVGAILYFDKNITFLKLFDNKVSQILAWLGILTITLNFKFVNSIVDTTIVTVLTLILIIGQINIKNRVINLDIPLFNFLGKISYGIYVYHILIIYLFSLVLENLVLADIWKVILVYASIITTTITIAYFSFSKFEKRFIKMKDKFAVVKSTSISNYNEKET